MRLPREDEDFETDSDEDEFEPLEEAAPVDKESPMVATKDECTAMNSPMEEPEPAPLPKAFTSRRIEIPADMIAKIQRLQQILDETPDISNETRSWVAQCAQTAMTK